VKVRLNPDIKEESEELRKMLLSEKDGRKKERIHILYLFKTGICKTIGDIAEKTGRNRNTVSGRIKKYKAGGLGLLCKREASPGRRTLLTEDETAIIKEKLCDPAGFGSYHKIYEYVENKTGKKINKKTLYHLCHYRLNAVSRVPGPYNPKRNDEDVRIFRETFSGRGSLLTDFLNN
jgi:transposase